MDDADLESRLCIAHLFSKPSTLKLDSCRCGDVILACELYCSLCSHECNLCAVCGKAISFDVSLAVDQCRIESKHSTALVTQEVFSPLIHGLTSGSIRSLEQLNKEYILKMTTFIQHHLQ